MKDIRLWVAVLSGTWFLAGLSAGHLLSARTSDSSPFRAEADRLTAEFQLDGLHRRGLLQVLDRVERQRSEIRRRHEAATRDAMEPDLRALYRQKDDFIRNKILPPGQRAAYDASKRPRAFTLNTSR